MSDKPNNQKQQRSLNFSDGTLTILGEGHPEKGDGWFDFVFVDATSQHEGRGWYFKAKTPQSELIAIRDFLNLTFPATVVAEEARDESSDMALTRETRANMLFVVHELKAGRALPTDWESRDFVRKAILSYATDMGLTDVQIAAANFTEEQLEGMRRQLQDFHGTLEPGEPFPRGLTFRALRSANSARCPMFKNAKGEPQHSGRDWSPNDWMVATFGELGEAANVMKKVHRGDMTLVEAHAKLAREFSDVVIYLDMLAAECGVDLGEAVMQTFNAKSDQLELPLYITETGPTSRRPE